MAFTDIDDPSAYFQTVLYVGNATARSITFDGNTDMQPDLNWTKVRNSGTYHNLADSVRGATKQIYSNASDAEASATDAITSFNSNGFSIGSNGDVNANTKNIVSWNWKESATAGFDIVSYTGNSSDGVTQQNISHSLSAVPQVIIIKNRTDATNWCVYHHKNTSAPETEIIYLNLTNATSDDSAFFGDTAPTSSIFTVGGDNGVNGNGDSMIAYCFAEKKGYSKFGSYTGNGASSANSGTFVYTGFKPSLVIVKNTGTEGWQMWDNKRSSYNGQGSNISPNSANAESTGVRVHFFSNGYQLVSSGADQNSSGATFIYMAFAESPFVTSTGIPTTAR
jgi:hypothetical protein